MTEIKVHLQKTIDDSYAIRIGSGILGEQLTAAVLAAKPSSVAVVLDSNLERHYASRLKTLSAAWNVRTDFLVFPAGERHKTIATVMKLVSRLARAGFDRKTLVVAFGGGVTGDMAGFLAAVAMRGIRFVQVPTSLLSMTDSSIGGKTGVDVPEGKNLVGAFYQPGTVIIDTDLLDTLPEREYINGMAEIVKHGMILDAKYFAALESGVDKFFARDKEYLARIITRSSEIKAGVVEADEKEKGLRRVLNFGHTVGHAIEAASHFAVPHGHAVAYGMVAEAMIAVERGLLDDASRTRLEILLGKYNLLSCNRAIGRIEGKKFLEAAGRDKKNSGGELRAALPRAVGAMYEASGEYSTVVTKEEMRRALESVR